MRAATLRGMTFFHSRQPFCQVGSNGTDTLHDNTFKRQCMMLDDMSWHASRASSGSKLVLSALFATIGRQGRKVGAL